MTEPISQAGELRRAGEIEFPVPGQFDGEELPHSLRVSSQQVEDETLEVAGLGDIHAGR